MKSIASLLSVCVFALSAMLLSAQTKPSIGVITGGEETFWKTFNKGLDAGAAEMGYSINRPASRPDTNYLQVKSVQEMIKAKVSAFIVSPFDSRALVRPLKDAESQGVKTILVGNKLKLPTYLSFLTVDNYTAGKLCAKKMAQLLDGKGKVVVIPFSPDNESTLQREKGFIDELKESAPEIIIYPIIQYAGPDYQQATYTTANVLTQYPFADGFFCSEELTSHCMLNALTSRKIATNKKLVGYGINEVLIEGLKSGKVDALAISDPYSIGVECVRLVSMSAKGEKIKNRIEFPVFIVDKASMKSENIKELILRQVPDAFKIVPPKPVVKPTPAPPAPAPTTTTPTTTKTTQKTPAPTTQGPAINTTPVTDITDVPTTTTVIVETSPTFVPAPIIIVNPQPPRKHHKPCPPPPPPNDKKSDSKTAPTTKTTSVPTDPAVTPAATKTTSIKTDPAVIPATTTPPTTTTRPSRPASPLFSPIKK